MENKEMKKPVPVSLEEEVLEKVSAGGEIEVRYDKNIPSMIIPNWLIEKLEDRTLSEE